MAIALASLGGVLGFALGWLAHRRLSLHYKERWLQAVGMLNAKALEDPEANAVVPLTVPTQQPRPYVAGRWALDERHEHGTATWYAIRNGFDDVHLGSAANYERYQGLYRVNRANAEQAVADMNAR